MTSINHYKRRNLRRRRAIIVWMLILIIVAVVVVVKMIQHDKNETQTVHYINVETSEQETTETITNNAQAETTEKTVLETTENTTNETTENQSTQVTTEPSTSAVKTPSDESFVLVEEYNYDQNQVGSINHPSSLTVLVNKLNQLPQEYVPEDLVIPNVKFSFSGDNPKKYMREEAARALEQMFQGAKENGYRIYALSGYRSYEKQKSLYTNYVSQYGQASADQFSAQPGKSEHQTGLAMDVTSESVGFELVGEFGETDEGKWLAENAHIYGFILRYPSDKTDITGYMYEPWHFRYVGVSLAQEIYRTKLSLEEYYESIQ